MSIGHMHSGAVAGALRSRSAHVHSIDLRKLVTSALYLLVHTTGGNIQVLRHGLPEVSGICSN